MKGGKGKKVLMLSLLLGGTSTGFADTTEDSITCSTYRIERQAFKSNTAKQATIPEGVTFIDKQAFADCPNLRSVSFPSTLQDIENAFVNCPLLESVDLSTASKLQCLDGSFKGCTSLTDVTLPETLEEIGTGTFEGCINFTHLKYGGEKPSVRFIGANAFKGTSVDRTPLLDKVECIGEGAFDTGKPLLWDFGDVAWVDDPVQSDEDLFETYPEATGIRSFDQLSLNPTTLSLTEKTLAQFPWKESVQVLFLPQEFQSLESLKGLVNLQDLEIPDGYRLSSVSDFIFDECSNLMMPAFIPFIETDGIFHTIPTEDKSIQSALVLYGAQALSPGTFQNCKNLTKVRLADSLQEVGEKAFSGCAELTSLTLPDSLEMIGNEAFSGCRALTSLDLPVVQSIGSEAFSGCAFDRIDLPKSLQFIGDKVCSGFSYEDLVLPDFLESIGTETFSNCLDLRSVTFPSSLQFIGEKAFSSCTKLSQLYGSHQISQLNENVFENCPELGVIQIFSYDDQKVMAGPLKDNLQTALVLQGAESIGREAFYGCSSLASIILPDSVQSIGLGAFSRCTKLVDIDVSKITLSVTNSIRWTSVFYFSDDRTRVTKVICRREQADKMQSVFTNATLTYVD